jgi:hypothetical protein
MRKYKITIKMPDGSVGRYTELFADGFDAINQTLDSFPEAARVSAMQITEGAQ